MHPAVPSVEIAEYRYALGSRGPDAENGSSYPGQHCRLASEVIIKSVICSEVKKVAVLFLQLREKTVRIIYSGCVTAVVGDFVLVRERVDVLIWKPIPLELDTENQGALQPLHFHLPGARDEFDRNRMRLKCPECNFCTVRVEMYAKKLKWVVVTPVGYPVYVFLHGVSLVSRYCEMVIYFVSNVPERIDMKTWQGDVPLLVVLSESSGIFHDNQVVYLIITSISSTWQ